MHEWIQENPQMFFVLVIAIAVVFIVIRIIAGISGKKKKKMALSAEDVAEITFNEDIFPASRTLTNQGLTGYKVFTVNGQEPRIVGGSLLVPPGKVLIDIQYIISGNSLGSQHTSSFERQQVSFELDKGKQYTMDYNVIEHSFSCNA